MKLRLKPDAKKSFYNTLDGHTLTKEWAEFPPSSHVVKASQLTYVEVCKEKEEKEEKKVPYKAPVKVEKKEEPTEAPEEEPELKITPKSKRKKKRA